MKLRGLGGPRRMLNRARGVLACLAVVSLGANETRRFRPRVALHSPRSPACESIRQTRDTVEYQVYATLVVPTVRVYNGKKLQQDTVTDDFRTYMLQAIRQHYVPPSAPALSVYGFGISENPNGASPVVFGQAVFSLTPTGGLANLQLVNLLCHLESMRASWVRSVEPTRRTRCRRQRMLARQRLRGFMSY